jgi:glucan biosynthesis protein C
MVIQKSPELANVKTVLTPDSGKRLLFIDNLRWLMIIFVVIMHLNVTYSTLGGWYYVEKHSLDIFSGVIFAIYGSFTQAYFMGFLFLIAGYFVPGSYDKKGALKFISDRFIRLGIPTLIFMLFLDPLTTLIRLSFVHAVPANLLSCYLSYLSGFQFIGASGPLWFAFALLIFSVIYALVRVARPKNKIPQEDNKPVSITHTHVIVVILLISIGAFLLRLVQPIGTSFYNMQLCYFSAYIVLFIIGIIAYRRNLLLNVPYRFGITWFKIALWAGIPLWMVMLIAGGAPKGLTLFSGGLYWQSAAYALWESFFCVGICLGLLVLFREKYNRQGRFSKFLAANAFAVYVFHAPILVAASMLVRGIAIYPLLKMVIMVMIMVPVCFGFAWPIRKIPGFAKIFS